MDAFTGTKPVAERHAFDIAALARHLDALLPGFAGPLTVEQFKGGQSNPTYKLVTPGKAYVMRATHTIFDAIRGEHIPKPAQIAFWAALVSIVSKEILYRKTVLVGRAIENDSVIANAWHHRSDAMSSVGTAIGIGAATFLGAEWTIMDPIAAIVVSFLLLKVAVDIVKDQIGGLTERSLSAEIHGEIEELALSFPDISYPHNIRTRAVGKTVVIDLHVRVNPEMRVADAHAVVSELERKLRARFGDDTIATVHIEPLQAGHEIG